MRLSLPVVRIIAVLFMLSGHISQRLSIDSAQEIMSQSNQGQTHDQTYCVRYPDSWLGYIGIAGGRPTV